MTKVEDFYISLHGVRALPSDEEYGMADMVIRSIGAVSRLTYKSLYIVDYFKNEFLFMSNNTMYLSGHTPEEVKEMGYSFYISNVPEKEHKMLIEVNRAGLDFICSAPESERLKYTISYDFHIVNGKRKTLVNHKITPVLLNAQGEIWLAACMISLSSRQESGHVRMKKTGERQRWEYSFVSKRWEEYSGMTISDRENEVLSLSAKGHTVDSIAEYMCISPDSVKFHKKNLFEKFGVRNITEALVYAENEDLL